MEDGVKMVCSNAEAFEPKNGTKESEFKEDGPAEVETEGSQNTSQTQLTTGNVFFKMNYSICILLNLVCMTYTLTLSVACDFELSLFVSNQCRSSVSLL